MKTHNLKKIALGGGCHWCTEAVFQSLKGVEHVAQGYVASHGLNAGFSEAVIVAYDASVIPLEILLEVHLLTHNSTANHSMRAKYRSAVYTFSKAQKDTVKLLMERLQSKFNKPLVTQILDFKEFKASREAIQNYYLKDPEKPFCQNYITPKLQLLRKEFLTHVEKDSLKHLRYENY